uniref:TSC22 domain family member 3 n=1 Tax=Chelonoidis abingdonii TaxID=106734 RepID=A0A8C0H5S5_CHEAB
MRQDSLEPVVRDPCYLLNQGICNSNIDQTLLSILLFFHSASGASVVAIDNKIEQAMDLVKTHLMYAVRRRWRSSREQIKELVEKNSQLERENSLLKTLASPKHGEIPVLAACRGAIRRGAGRGGCPGPAHQGSAV